MKIKDPNTINYKRLFSQAERYANLGSWEVDFTTDEVTWSDQYYRVCGFQPREIRPSMDKTLAMVHPDDAVQVQTEYERARTAGKPFHVEFRLIRADGVMRHVLAEANIERNSDGAPARMVGIFMDIHDRKEVELKMEMQQLRYEALMKNGLDAAAIVQHDGGMTYLSPSCEGIFGWSDVDTLDVTLLDIVHPEDMESLTRTLQDTLVRPAEVIEIDPFRIRHKNGSWMHLEGKMENLLHQPAVEGIIFNFKDGSSRHVQQERRQVMEEITGFFSNPGASVNDALGATLSKLGESGKYKLREAWMVAPGRDFIELKVFGKEEPNASTFYRETAKFRQLKPNECVAGAVWNEGKRLLVNDITSGNRFVRKQVTDTMGVKRVCGIPIRHLDETIGVMVMGVDEETLIPNQEMDFMEDVGRTIGTEIRRRTAEDDLNDLFELAPDLVTLLDEENTLIRVNPASARILGYVQDDLRGLPLSEMLHPDDLPAAVKKLDKVREKNVTIAFEARVLTRTGTILWMDFNASVSAGTGHTFLMGRDITQRRQLEYLVEQASRLSSIGAWEIDVRRDQMTWSDVARDIFGVTPTFTPTLQGFISLVRRGVSRGKIKHVLEKALEAGEGWDSEVEIVTGTGQSKWVRIIGQVDLADNEPVRVYGSIQDIHDRKIAEIMASEVSEEKELILSSISDAFYALDEEWRFSYVNRRAEEIFGRSASFLNTKTIWDMPGHHNNPSLIPVMEYVQKHRVPRTAEYFDEKLEAWFDLSIYPYGKGVSVYFRDVTERRRVEAELHELTRKLEDRAREMALSNAELEQFAFVASHDLQEPLRMITGFMDRLEKRYGAMLDERGKRYIHFATDAAKRMREIILDLLEFSRIDREEESVAEVDVNTILGELMTSNKRYLDDTGSFMEFGKMPVVVAQPDGIRRVFQCLINNAIKYTHKHTAEPRVSISWTETENQWQFTVKDNGIGIAPEHHEEIFVLFRRLHSKDDYAGSGMGLPIAKKIINNHQGRIWVNAAIGQGSTFHFTLPKPLHGSHKLHESGPKTL